MRESRGRKDFISFKWLWEWSWFASPLTHKQAFFSTICLCFVWIHLNLVIQSSLMNHGSWKFRYRISTISFLPLIVTFFNNFRGNYSIYEVKDCHNAETIWKFPHFSLSKENSFLGNYIQTYVKKISASKNDQYSKKLW